MNGDVGSMQPATTTFGAHSGRLSQSWEGVNAGQASTGKRVSMQYYRRKTALDGTQQYGRLLDGL